MILYSFLLPCFLQFQLRLHVTFPGRADSGKFVIMLICLIFFLSVLLYKIPFLLSFTLSTLTSSFFRSITHITLPFISVLLSTSQLHVSPFILFPLASFFIYFGFFFFFMFHINFDKEIIIISRIFLSTSPAWSWRSTSFVSNIGLWVIRHCVSDSGYIVTARGTRVFHIGNKMTWRSIFDLRWCHL